MPTYQERLDMFAAAALKSEYLDPIRGWKGLVEASFLFAKKMIEESDRICAERQARITAAAEKVKALLLSLHE